MAFDGDHAVYFTDAVREGEVVNVYASLWHAERDYGHFERRVVRRVDGEWRLAEPEPDGTQGIAGASRSSQGVLDGDAPVPGSASRAEPCPACGHTGTYDGHICEETEFSA